MKVSSKVYFSGMRPLPIAMSVVVTRVEGMKFKAEADGLEVVSGRVGEGAPLEGMTPGRLLTASLGLCTAMTLAGYCEEKGIKCDDLRIVVTAKTDKALGRAVAFEMEISMAGPLTEKERDAVLEAAKSCYVGKTLRGSPNISYKLIVK